jgi:hypothetical protein
LKEGWPFFVYFLEPATTTHEENGREDGSQKNNNTPHDTA